MLYADWDRVSTSDLPGLGRERVRRGCNDPRLYPRRNCGHHDRPRNDWPEFLHQSTEGVFGGVEPQASHRMMCAGVARAT